MSYANHAKSVEYGEPIECVVFEYGYGKFFGVTNLDRDIYIPFFPASNPIEQVVLNCVSAPLSRDGISVKGTIESNGFTIKTDRNLDIVKVIMGDSPNHVVTVTVFRLHFNDPAKELRQIWYGRVLGCSVDGIEASIECDPYSTKLRRSGLTRNYQRNCMFPLYGHDCKAVKKAFPVTVVGSLQDRKIEVASDVPGIGEFAFNAADRDHFLGGFAVWPDSILGRRVGNIVGVEPSSPIFRMGDSIPAIGAKLWLYKGCDRGESSCRDIHNNLANHGGFPWVPTKNPVGKVSTYF